jgi:hypothetical protein
MVILMIGHKEGIGLILQLTGLGRGILFNQAVIMLRIKLVVEVNMKSLGHTDGKNGTFRWNGAFADWQRDGLK